MSRPTRRRLAAWLGAAGGGLGILAGVVQTTVGSQIPVWSGAKADPRALGLLTVLLSALALLAALRQSRPGLTTGLRGLAALALLVPGLLCLTTVGRLWYLPGLLIISAGILTVDSWTDTASVVRQNWLRCLLSGLGACQLLMAAGSTGVRLDGGGGQRHRLDRRRLLAEAAAVGPAGTHHPRHGAVRRARLDRSGAGPGRARHGRRGGTAAPRDRSGWAPA